MKQKSFSIRNNEESGSNKSWVLEGDLGLKNAASLRKSLLETRFANGENVMHIRNVEKLDITTIQNIQSLRKQLESSGKKLVVEAELPDSILRLMANTGFSSTF